MQVSWMFIRTFGVIYGCVQKSFVVSLVKNQHVSISWISFKNVVFPEIQIVSLRQKHLYISTNNTISNLFWNIMFKKMIDFYFYFINFLTEVELCL